MPKKRWADGKGLVTGIVCRLPTAGLFTITGSVYVTILSIFFVCGTPYQQKHKEMNVLYGYLQDPIPCLSKLHSIGYSKPMSRRILWRDQARKEPRNTGDVTWSILCLCVKLAMMVEEHFGTLPLITGRVKIIKKQPLKKSTYLKNKWSRRRGNLALQALRYSFHSSKENTEQHSGDTTKFIITNSVKQQLWHWRERKFSCTDNISRCFPITEETFTFWVQV